MQRFEPQKATRSEHFAGQDVGLSQILQVIISNSAKRL